MSYGASSASVTLRSLKVYVTVSPVNAIVLSAVLIGCTGLPSGWVYSFTHDDDSPFCSKVIRTLSVISESPLVEYDCDVINMGTE